MTSLEKALRARQILNRQTLPPPDYMIIDGFLCDMRTDEGIAKLARKLRETGDGTAT